MSTWHLKTAEDGREQRIKGTKGKSRTNRGIIGKPNIAKQADRSPSFHCSGECYSFSSTSSADSLESVFSHASTSTSATTQSEPESFEMPPEEVCEMDHSFSRSPTPSSLPPADPVCLTSMKRTGAFREKGRRNRPEIAQNSAKRDESEAVQDLWPMELESCAPFFGLQMGKDINETLFEELQCLDKMDLAGSFSKAGEGNAAPRIEFKEKVAELYDSTFFERSGDTPTELWNDIRLVQKNDSFGGLNYFSSQGEPIHDLDWETETDASDNKIGPGLQLELTHIQRTIFEEDLLSITDHDGEEPGDASSLPQRCIFSPAEKQPDSNALDQRLSCLEANMETLISSVEKFNTRAQRQNISEPSPTCTSRLFGSPSLCQSNIPPQISLRARNEHQKTTKLERSVSPCRKSISTIETTPPSGEEEFFSGSSSDSSFDIDFLSSEPDANAAAIHYIACKIKAGFLQNVMEQFHNIFDDTSFVGYANTGDGGNNNPKGGKSSLALSRASSRSLAGSNISTGGNSPAGDDDDDHASGEMRTPPTERQPQTLPRLACPFFKRDPVRQTKSSCYTAPGFVGIKRVKEHLKRVHRQPIFCFRCFETFRTKDDLEIHSIAETICNVKSRRERPEGVTDEQFKILKMKMRPRTEEGEWRRVYRTLFPEDDESSIPSPYYAEMSTADEYDLAGFEAYARQNLPPRVEDHFKDLMEKEGVNALIEEFIERESPNAFHKCLDDMRRSYRPHQQSTAVTVACADYSVYPTHFFSGTPSQTTAESGLASVLVSTPISPTLNTLPTAQEVLDFNRSRITQPPDSGYGSIQPAEPINSLPTQSRAEEDHGYQPIGHEAPYYSIFDIQDSNAYGNVSHQPYTPWVAPSSLQGSYLLDEYPSVPDVMPPNQSYEDLEDLVVSTNTPQVDSTFSQHSTDTLTDMEEIPEISPQENENTYFHS